MGKIIKNYMSFYKNITIIIVSYESEKLIIQNLETLKKFPTIIIDNSKSNKLSHLINDFKNIKLITPDLNLGYGKANNLGVNKSKTPYILIVNPDILLNEQLINTLYSEFLNYNDDIGVIGPSLYDSNMKRRTNGSISHVKKIKGRKLSNSLNNIPENNMCCDFLVGCCLFMRRDFFLELGGFDKDFFMYFEDNDLCDRIIKKGKTVVEVPSAKVIHLENSSSKKNYFQSYKLSIIHKISEYIYLKKNVLLINLILIISKNFIDYLQRFIINLLILRFKKSLKNFFRLISILLYVTMIYKLIF
jgi:N-acetylglucosaminyl-diphospho-decaprenol L-rhamnosyltransferase